MKVILMCPFCMQIPKLITPSKLGMIDGNRVLKCNCGLIYHNCKISPFDSLEEIDDKIVREFNSKVKSWNITHNKDLIPQIKSHLQYEVK